MKQPSEETRKITANLPASLLDSLLHETGQGVTEMLTDLMRKEKSRLAWKAFADLRGKVKFDMTWQELRGLDEDRDLSAFLTPDKK